MFSTILDTLPGRAQKRFVKGMIGSLNASIIGNVRGHIRQDALERQSQIDDIPNIDMLNDAMAAIDESNQRNHAFGEAGIVILMPSIEIARHMNVIRHFLVDFLNQHKSTEFDVPLSIADTLDFQIKNSPSINEARLRALAKAVNKDYDLLKHLQIESFRIEREQLMKVAGQVLTIVESLEDDGDADEAFSSLPAHVQYKLIASAIRALGKAGDDALIQLLRFQKMDGATDHTLIEAVSNNLTIWLSKFAKERAHELDAYIERGGNLPEINEPPVSTPDAILTA